MSASCRPSIRTVRVTPPAPGSRPSVTSGTPISYDPSAAIRWWQASAISSPPPSAAPLIAATTGTPSVSSARSCRLTSSSMSKTCWAFSGWICRSISRLPPAKNVSLALVITTPVIASFSATSRSTVRPIAST